MQWNPFRDDELAVGLENGLVNIWHIPDDVKCIGNKEGTPIPELQSKVSDSKKETVVLTEKKLADLEPFKVLKVGEVGVKVTQVR